MAFSSSTIVRRAAALMLTLTAVSGQEYPGLPWIQSEFDSSPPVYPSPNATGTAWETSFARAADFVSQLTLEEKTWLVTGTAGPCVGNIAPIPRLGFKGLCLQDGPLAIRQATYASTFPAGLTVAASWDRDLAYRRGEDLGEEFKGKGAHIMLGPVAGPLGRSGYGGRNWEGFSPEPYLTGEMFAKTIEGSQAKGLQACAKHYIGNEQETQRNPSITANGTTIEAVSSNIDDRTMHEVYLWPFANAVKSGVASFMCSYNRVNGTYGCMNSKTLNGLLKDELGFQGYVMSDWGGTHSGLSDIEGGHDMDMPGGISFGNSSAASYYGNNLTASVTNGSLSIERVDDMCRRIMTPYFHLNQDDYPPIDGSEAALNSLSAVSGYLYNFTYGPSNVDVRGDHAKLIRELGAAGIVLLKNTNNALPLKKPKNVGVFGNAAGPPSDGLYFGGATGLLAQGGFEYGALPVGGGSGTGRISYLSTPLDAIQKKVDSQDNDALVQYILNNELITQVNGYTIIAPSPPDVCLVFVKTWATEGFDRPSLLVDLNGTAVVEKIASQCPNTVVITTSGGLNVLPFADHPNVTAILAAHFGGNEQGNSLVDVLWGAVNPSGHLPYTIAKNESDYAFADITNSSALLNTTDPNAWQSNYKERLLTDYRWFDYFNESVQYPFGHGLSYTTFSISNISVSKTIDGSISAAPPSQPIAPGGNPALWEKLYTISVSVKNTGSIAGAAVPQLYLGLPGDDGTPLKVLRGFEKILLKPGQSETVAFDLVRRDISSWDVVTQQWVIGSGAVEAFAGLSSRDIQATASFSPL